MQNDTPKAGRPKRPEPYQRCEGQIPRSLAARLAQISERTGIPKTKLLETALSQYLPSLEVGVQHG